MSLSKIKTSYEMEENVFKKKIKNEKKEMTKKCSWSIEAFSSLSNTNFILKSKILFLFLFRLFVILFPKK